MLVLRVTYPDHRGGRGDSKKGTCNEARPGPPGLHVKKFGRGSQTILLIHGFTDSSDTWSRVIPTLARHYRVIAVDLPGFGHATRNWPQPLIPGYVELLRELICKQRRKQVTVIGNSLGPSSHSASPPSIPTSWTGSCSPTYRASTVFPAGGA